MNDIQEDARSEEHMFDKRFIQRWADRCIQIRQEQGQEAANAFARRMFSAAAMKEVKEELVRRFGK